MANEEHVSLLKQDVKAWNAWREENPDVRLHLSRADLSGAYLPGADLYRADLSGADLSGAYLSGARLSRANLSRADLSGAKLPDANLSEANLSEANLSKASLVSASLCGAHLARADLSWAHLARADLFKTDLSEANLSEAFLCGAYLLQTDLSRADLSRADLSRASLVETDFTDADLTDCRIYGISAWDLKLNGATQENLIVTRESRPDVTVDDIEVAQFIYLLLNNEKIRNVIDIIGKKAVLILGRFTPERKKVLDALREELRNRDYVPILFDFDKPASQDLTATISTLAHMARFIIADLTDPSSIPYELATIVPTTPVPVQPILVSGQREFSMFVDLQRRYRWVLAPHCYENRDQLIAELSELVIHPAECRVLELQGEAKEVP